MRRLPWAWLFVALAVGCGEGTPPLDELPLRDTLRAEPAVVAALDDSARQRLAARFEVVATEDITADAVAAPTTPANEVASLDDTRVRRAADALVVGALGDGVARPLGAGVSDKTPLPQLEGEVATSTAALEARSLDGAAGARLRALLLASGAHRLERVVGWPTGAIAIGETIYVDASWLVALAPVQGGSDGSSDGSDGADGGTSRSPTARAAGDSTPSGVVSGTPASIAVATSAASFDGYDAGTVTPPPPPPPPTSGPSFWDACSASSDTCAASSDSCDTSSSDDSSCSGTDDGSADSCSTPPDDGSDCRVSPGRERPRAATIVWVLAPLGFLIGRRR